MARPGRRTTGLLSIVAVVVILSILIPYFIAALKKAESESNKVACRENLREIAEFAMLYAVYQSKPIFPLGPGQNPAAHESLNVMVGRFFASLKPDLFICPSWHGRTVKSIPDGRFRLTADTCPYSWVGEECGPTDLRPLASDKYVWSFSRQSGHYGGMNVVYTDASVKFVKTVDLGADGLPEGLVR